MKDTGNYIGMAVYGYRRGNSQDTVETVTRVIATGNHRYGGQGETVIKAAMDRHPRPRWYVGYGADYIPAGRGDLANITVLDSI